MVHFSREKQAWQEALSDLITDPKELLALLQLDPALLEQAYAAARIFPLKVPRGYVDRMRKGDPQDPLLLQILPLGAEMQETRGYSTDPLNESETNPVPGLLHKYKGRVLVTLTGVCAVNCRYCFRRFFPYEENNPGKLGWEKIFSYIKQHTEINEVILSGGDPLAVSDRVLRSFSEQLSAIPQIKRLRIHTRLPIVLPERMTNELISWMGSLQQTPILIVHANHAREINNEVRSVLLALRAAGVTLLNQSVLLQSINDNVQTLTDLSEALFAAGVLPYYLNLLDKVQGTAHFNVERNRGLALHAELAKHLPGYLVPRLVKEEPGEASKTVLSTAMYTG